ncbi:MAG: alcohol dehydrogenase catalytic domain-containing protein, partial [Anaerolineae bacterium]|nr:alcohol dehydrogenase catalytic domain-containing protein [Anaerolineae bacterium]
MITSYPMAKVTQAGQISWVDRTLPEFGSHDVLIQVRASAVCGSDLHIFKGKHPSAPLPAAIGHELAGEILSVGADVTRLKVGDRVTVEPVLACGHCYYCRRGQYHLCEQISFQYRRGQGGFTPYFVVNEERAFRLPANLDYAEGALVEPLSVALHAVKKANLRLGQSCAIFGAGAIGLMALMLARRSAAANIFVSDVHTFRLQKAL